MMLMLGRLGVVQGLHAEALLASKEARRSRKATGLHR